MSEPILPGLEIPPPPVKVTATVNVNTIIPYLVAIVIVFAIGAGTAVWAPTQVGTIIAAAAPILMALLALLKGQSDQAKVQTEIHEAVNSKSDLILRIAKELAQKQGVEIGREQVREETKVAVEEAKSEDKPPTTKVPLPPD